MTCTEDRQVIKDAVRKAVDAGARLRVALANASGRSASAGCPA
ncbi:hypothetical protein XNC1_2870 [Xenorhabdus nematophila ATCC 19061]|uniref:Uncharacterized protein n=1 Tax=Xenorhabdus nematophila (strain ATCC 19061 / DSM 3370 / CCUG 14189 / LMG 1036 / NCIMB 9965 / AN6) TaxID=406817 RepID=D3VJ67_XENNA|nr:hypothetical protein XNC1_2870 [Xenorhabdus nematophila ATCC 19061]